MVWVGYRPAAARAFPPPAGHGAWRGDLARAQMEIRYLGYRIDAPTPGYAPGTRSINGIRIQYDATDSEHKVLCPLSPRYHTIECQTIIQEPRCTHYKEDANKVFEAALLERGAAQKTTCTTFFNTRAQASVDRIRSRSTL